MAIDLVQAAKPVAYDAMHEGTFAADEHVEVIEPRNRGSAFRQLLLSAEVQSRVEFWREVAPHLGDTFTAGWIGGPCFLGDSRGRVHYSEDNGLTWRVIKKLGSAVAQIFHDSDYEGHVWFVTAGGQIWRLKPDYGFTPWQDWPWVKVYDNPAVEFVGIGVTQYTVVAFLKDSDQVLRATNLQGETWSLVTVFPAAITPAQVYTDVYGDPVEIWVAAGNDEVFYTDDNGTSFTAAAAVGAISLAVVAYNGTTCAGSLWDIKRSTDDGATWATVHSFVSERVVSFGVGDYVWLALTNKGGVYVSSDEGLTWTLKTRYVNHGYGSAAEPGESGVTAMVKTAASTSHHALALFEGGLLVSLDDGANWRAGAAGEPWVVSIDAFQPVVLDLLYQLPGRHRLIGAASAETFVLVLA